jgi:hypothetical protein
MRCYLMKGGHIAAVEILENCPDDYSAIRAASECFFKREREGFEGFELWDRQRLVHRYPDPDNLEGGHSGNGAMNGGASRPPGKKAADMALAAQS